VTQKTAIRPWNGAEAAEIVAAHRDVPGAMLPILHALQEAFGYVDAAAIPIVAEALNVSKAEVHGVIGFYHDFRDTRPGKHVLKLCRAEACQSMGCESLIDHVERRLRVKLGETSGDGAFTVEAVYCLGNCALSPAAMLDGKLYGRVTSAAADKLIDAARSRA
jgi:formate dehydrogenase subunit gamma